MNVAEAIGTLLVRLNRILDQLESASEMSGEDLEQLIVAWDEDISVLESHTVRFPEGVTPGDGTRERMTRFVNRMAEVQPQLVRLKSEVADQLFSENRRVQSLRRGYGAMAQEPGLIHHKA